MEHDWITDRRPTEADGDEDGDVFVRAAPGVDDGWCHHWSYVGERTPWTHTGIWWKPAVPAPAAPEPPSTTPRKIVAISSCGDERFLLTTALADDGTAWVISDDAEWRRIPPLPAREVQANV